MRDRLRNLIDPISATSVEHPLRNGAIVLIVGVLLIAGVVTRSIPLLYGDSGATVRADFATVNNVNDRTPVRVHGVEVGHVTGVGAGPDPRRSSEIRMLITDSSIVVHDDAQATLRWRTVLGGPMFVDLSPGSSTAPRLGDAAIPVTRTSSQVELDDLLRVYDGSTDQAQRSMLQGLSSTFASPASTQSTLRALPDLAVVGKGLRPYLGTEPGDLTRLVANTAATVDALGADVNSLRGLVSGASQTFGATNAQSAQLGRTLALSPGTLDSTETTMRRLTTTLGHLDPLVKALDPGVALIDPASRSADPALGQARALLDEARPLLHSARPAFDNLRAVSRVGAPLLRGLTPTVDRLNNDILPWLARRDGDTKLLNYESIGPFFSVVDMGAAEYDPMGNRLHLSTLLGTSSVLSTSVSTLSSSYTQQCQRVARSARERSGCQIVGQAITAWIGGQPRGRR